MTSNRRWPSVERLRSVARRRTRSEAATVARRVLAQVADGRLARLPLAVRFWDGSTMPAAGTEATADDADPPVVVLGHRRAVAHLLHKPGQLGLARAWVDGSASVEGDPERVLALRNGLSDAKLTRRDQLRLAAAAVGTAGPGVLRRPPIPSIEARVGGRRHSIPRDRQAVRHHYDVSNEFYRLILGPSMVYSCAYFSHPDGTLEAAQKRKLDLICRKLRLARGDRLLDIGCGWGSLVIHAAANYGVRAVGVTVSEPQAALARERVREQGLEDRIEVRVADYREVRDGPFDKVASVGMYEHVGRSELNAYVGRVETLLRPGGLFLNHGIARLFSQPPSSETFIWRYIFPDGELHPVTDVMVCMQRSGLEVHDVESLREHYPLTLRRWLANLQAHRDEAIALVGPERERTWELYLLASALGFEDRDTTVYQVLTSRHDGSTELPLDRAELLSKATAGATLNASQEAKLNASEGATLDASQEATLNASDGATLPG
jgi:cyclopropane-fatty-acyl-phospholipid synthase